MVAFAYLLCPCVIQIGFELDSKSSHNCVTQSVELRSNAVDTISIESHCDRRNIKNFNIATQIAVMNLFFINQKF